METPPCLCCMIGSLCELHLPFGKVGAVKGCVMCFIGHILSSSDIHAFKSYPGSRMGLLFLIASSIFFLPVKYLVM